MMHLLRAGLDCRGQSLLCLFGLATFSSPVISSTNLYDPQYLRPQGQPDRN